MQEICSVDGCERAQYGRQDVCEAHYRRRRRTGDIDAARPVGEFVAKTCMVATCDNAATERGLCHGHYLRLIRHGDVKADQPLDRRVNSDCIIPACPNRATARGLCSTHRARQKAGGLMPDIPIKVVPGTGSISHGYRKIPVPKELRHLVYEQRNEFEHRVVMAMMLGRPLTSDESVHHRSGNRLDNRPENLELWTRWQPSGQRVSDRIRAALELLERYTPELLAGSQDSEKPQWSS